MVTKIDGIKVNTSTYGDNYVDINNTMGIVI